MSNSKQQFSSFSVTRLVKTIIARAFVGYFIVLLFNELMTNFHWGVAITEAILVVIFVIVDQKEVIISNDTLRIQTNYLFGIFHKRSDFRKAKIETIDLYGEYSMKSDIMEDILSIIFFKRAKSNQLVIITTDGKLHTYDLYIYKQDLEKAISLLGF